MNDKYLELPWTIDVTILNLKDVRDRLATRLLRENVDGKGEQDKKEVEFDFDRAIAALEAQQADMWIPVTERLPTHRYNKRGEPVEFVVMIRGATEPTTLSIDSNGTWYDPMGDYYNIASLMSSKFDVIAWRSLPAPYKEDV